MEGDTVGKALLAFGAGTAGALALWWLWNAESRKENVKADLSTFQQSVAKVEKLWVYPVKSCKGVELSTAHCGIRGLKHDRCWVVVNKEGCFVTQRQCPTMALISPRLEIREIGGAEDVILHLSAPGMSDISVKEPPADTPSEQVRVWNMYGEGVDVGRDVALWLDQYLGDEGYKMYYMSPRLKGRMLMDDDRWRDMCKQGEQTGFADFAPLLMISEASLQLLNTHTESYIPMECFRPNIVISNCLPHKEDEWGEFKVGDVLLRNIKPCGRCKLTTVDHQRGEFTGPEPLETLGKYRLYETVYNKKDSRFGPSPIFGSNCGVVQTGTLSVGDIVTI